MRRGMLAITLLFLIGFLSATIYAAADRGFTILTVLSLAIVVLMGIGIVGAIFQDPDGD